MFITIPNLEDTFNMAGKKKIILDSDLEYDFYLLGLSSYEKDYRIVWEINKERNFHFHKIDDHIVYHRKSGIDQHFSAFLYDDEQRGIQYKIIRNHSETGPLLEEHKNIDYVLIIRGEIDEEEIRQHKSALATLSAVQAVFIFELSKIKNKDRLLDN